MANPTLLTNNRIRLADLIVTSQEADHPIEDVYSDKRWEFWRPTTIADQDIEIRPAAGFQELLINPDFETGLNTEGWELDQGGGTATFTRNLTAPISGSADAELDVTVFVAKVQILSEKRYDLKADIPVSMSWQAKTASGTVNVTAFILNEDGSTEEEFDTVNVGTSLTAGSLKHVPSADLEGVRFGIRVDAVTDLFIDDISATVDRKANTLMIDAGSRLSGATVDVQFRDDLIEAWTSVSNIAVNGAAGGSILNDNVQYITFDTQEAKFYRVRFSSLDVLPEVVGLYLGQSFIFSTPPLGSIDPFGDRLIYNDQDGLHGDMSRTFRGHQNRFTIRLELPGDDRVIFEQFRDDIQRGRFPFWFNWNTDLFPRRWKLYLIDSKRWEVPFEAGGAGIRWTQPVIEIGRERES